GHLAEPERLRAMVGEHLERTKGELAAVREAREHASGVPEWAFPALALRWSERQHLAELELAEALLTDLDALSEDRRGPGRQADGDAPTPG
ncbi:PadR family transcriptional regulator, partial [Streptomyces sp. NPDC054840]